MDTRPLEEQIAGDLAGVLGRLTRAIDEIALGADRERAAKLVTTRDNVKAALTAFSG